MTSHQLLLEPWDRKSSSVMSEVWEGRDPRDQSIGLGEEDLVEQKKKWMQEEDTQSGWDPKWVKILRLKPILWEAKGN